MNLVQARQFVELDQSPFKENMPKQQAAHFKTCLRVFQRTWELSHTEKIGLLEALQSKIVLNDEHEPLIKKVQSVLASIQADQQRIENKMHTLAQRYRNQLEHMRDLFVDYAILDSLPELPGSTDGVSEKLAIQFFLVQLENFNRSSPSMEVSRLIQALEDLFELSIYTYDQWYDLADRVSCPVRNFKSKVLHLLQKMSEERLPYFFLPCCSSDHAMIGKVEYLDQEGYRFTLINTGSGVRILKGGKACDAVYSGLSQKDVMAVARSLLVESASATEVYAKIAEALPLKSWTYFNSRRHGLQKRESCAVKSLTVSMHGVLPEQIYWPIKVFYTEKLMQQMALGPRYGAACQILTKRTRKMLQHRGNV